MVVSVIYVPDTTGMMMSDWRVEADGRTVSNHKKKERAKEKARKVAEPGEQIDIYTRQHNLTKTETG